VFFCLWRLALTNSRPTHVEIFGGRGKRRKGENFWKTGSGAGAGDDLQIVVVGATSEASAVAIHRAPFPRRCHLPSSASLMYGSR